VYSNYQSVFEELSKEDNSVVFTNELPEIHDNNKSKTLIILDDLMLELATKHNEYITQLFIGWSHHRNVSVIVTWQNLYPHQNLKTVSDNATYYILFPMKRSKVSLDIFNRQLMPDYPTFIREAMKDVEKVKYQFLLIDCSNEVDFPFRVRNFILPIKDSKLYVPS